MKIAFSLTLGHVDFVHPDVAASVTAAANAFAELGADVVEMDPDLSDAEAVFRTHWFASAAAAVSAIPMEKYYLLDSGLKEIIMWMQCYGVRLYPRRFPTRRHRRTDGSLFQEYDLLITPGQPLPAFEAGAEFPDNFGFERWHQWTPYTYPFNLTQQPAASVPCGFTQDGLPVGLQIIGARFTDGLVLKAARAYEADHPFEMPEGPISGG